MQLFIDSANLNELEQAAEWGTLAGVTTNPTLLAKQSNNRPVEETIKRICALFPNAPVSMEVTDPTASGMLAQGRHYATWAPNIYVKVPFCQEGMKAVAQFSKEGIRTNVTLVFSLNQVLLAANAGASLISSFVGRLDDIGHDGIAIIEQAVDLMHTHGFESKILAASIRNPLHVQQAAQAGAHIATIPFNVLQAMYHHPLTASGIAAFEQDWQALQNTRTA